MGGKIDHSINRGNAPYTFRLSGENYNCLGSLLPLDGRKAQFSQLYIYDTENEISNRQRVFGENNSKVNDQEKHIINYLKTMLDSNNHLVQAYRMVRDCFEENPQLDLKLRIIGTRQHDARQYNLPSSYEVSALIVGDIGDAVDNQDIIVNILHKNVSSSSTAAHKKVTMREFFAYRIQDRPNTFSTMLNGRRLFQQILVDKYTMIEAQRLHFIRGKQHELRCDTYQSLRGMQAVGNTNVSTAGQRMVRLFKDTKLNSEDRPDILCRLFKVKFDAMIKLVKDKSLFGRVQAVVYTIEFQKRGLPHAHICIFLHPGSKIHNPKDVDKFISAEIANKDTDPDLYKLVSDHMIHGPCGDANLKCTCMSDIMMDNKTVVPYNKTLLKKFQAHVNVGWCNQDGSIKYVSACEAAWWIFGFDVHYRFPSVMRLAFHLPGEQQVIYGANEDIEDILNKTTNASSIFTGWFECNKKYDLEKTLTYAEFPTKYVWKKQCRKWEPRQRGFAIGRVHVVPAAFDEAYYLRILLNKVKGPECFEDIRTVDGVVCETFRDACYKRGLLDNDKEYIEAIEEASHTSTGYYLRNLFATMLITYSLSRPHFVWESTWQLLVDCILYKQQKDQNNPGLILNEEQLKNLALLEIENFLICNNSSLRRHQQMPFPDIETISRATNPLMVEDLSYDTETMNNEFNHLFDSLTDEQRGVYNEIMNALVDKKGDVVLNVASSGIASLLLEGGRTAHSRFLIPINLTEDSICPVKGNTDVYELLRQTSLIIWDEAPMIHKHAFEALDRTLNDVMNGDSANTSESLFGGKVVVFGGDFRQILPVVTNVGCRSSDVENIKEFADWLLDIGQGTLGGPNDGESVIDIPDDLLILNSVDPIGDLIRFVYPNHRLVLKVGVPIMLLRNINHKKGLCNGTRLQVVSLGRRVIEAKVVSGTNIGYHTLISRVSLTPTDKKIPFKLKRRQFPISVCFAMTINKSQGQSLSRVGLYLKDPIHQIGLRKNLPCEEETNLINVLHHFFHDLYQEVLPYEHVREWFFYPYQNKVVIWFENEEYKNFKPKQLLSCDDLVILRELDMLKLANTRKELAHLELEAEVSSKVKWLEECSNYESDYEDFPNNFESDDEH
ncbi:uncharacterized protein LOC143597361 [Bidens hawaiensis]|uniref:uncharacterized protein LOC143597361 n=1 Tax=Bidens hawaiensis TaxID=980011 RepID=UPI00404A0E96